ncbi:MAG: hypothetical protein LBM01_00930 [Christensenellaceae bacterium]|nr:hypothetical protein [Christensenellaceae bacterium]
MANAALLQIILAYCYALVIFAVFKKPSYIKAFFAIFMTILFLAVFITFLAKL